MKFQIGQTVQVTVCGKTIRGVVHDYESFIFGILYSVRLEDGSVVNKLGWNNLEAI